ncbi:hypothetical protein BG011_005631 [Mortierella polycephala]|uniref:Uncharacterized protein n=1 Tax=Mortierella polycephala TaxID=41804 RepID=A0A9P6U123_9FUNG|nr:hypothetical protein BG011_005631 [Mortierella polycephala]
MKFTTLSFIAAIAAPALVSAKTWDVNINNNKFDPQELDVAPGDSVRWPMTGSGDHAIVQTNDGAPSCNSKAGGFNSGRKTQGQAYQRTFPNATTINYKDGIGANCLNGAKGTIFVHTGDRPAGNPGAAPGPIVSTSPASAPASAPASVPASASASAPASASASTPASTSMSNSGSNTGSTPTPTSTHVPILGAANGMLTPGKSILLGAACLIGTLVL